MGTSWSQEGWLIARKCGRTPMELVQIFVRRVDKDSEKDKSQFTGKLLEV